MMQNVRVQNVLSTLIVQDVKEQSVFLAQKHMSKHDGTIQRCYLSSSTAYIYNIP